jgi:hypothetical protein
MPKRWVSRTFRTCVPGIQAAGLSALACDAHDLWPHFLVERAVDVQMILATVLSTGQGTSVRQSIACPPQWQAEGSGRGPVHVALTSDAFWKGLSHAGL